MANDKIPLHLTLEHLLIDEVPPAEESEAGEETPPSAVFGRHSSITATPADSELAAREPEQFEVPRPAAGNPLPPLRPTGSRGIPARTPPDDALRRPATAAPSAAIHPELPGNIDRDQLRTRIEKELLDEFHRILPQLMDEALDHMVEMLPVLINDKLTTRMLDYLLENRIRILKESAKKSGL